ncbi:MAG: DUF3823 domain-containing protein [Proteiniphilum sp.]|nr:DUF3823 domain-containing protein [Bacilli bacterium]
MKKVLFIIVVILAFFTSCELDNYDAPNAKIFGKIIDSETGEPIQQEILEGSRIDYIELGDFANPPTQQMRFKTDGSFRNDLMFAGKYHIQARRGNFFILPADTIIVKGETEYNIVTEPYIRIKNVSYAIEGRDMVASFQLEQVADYPVKSIAIFADLNPNVSQSLRKLANVAEINKNVSPDETFTLKMKLDPFMDIIPDGKPSFYFRVGALISGMPEAKYNYSEPKKIEIDYSTLPPVEPEIPGNVIDDCESLTGWGSGGFQLSLDTDAKQGNFSIKAEGQGVVIYQKKFAPFDTQVDKETGTLAFSLFILDTSPMKAGDSSIEITSSGGPDVEELAWRFGEDFEVTNGWNKIELKLKDGRKGGEINLNAVNFIRIYHTNITAPMVFKIDNIRFY